jgi:hypothetical protein
MIQVSRLIKLKVAASPFAMVLATGGCGASGGQG